LFSNAHKLLIVLGFALAPASFDKSTPATSKQRVGGSSPSGRATFPFNLLSLRIDVEFPRFVLQTAGHSNFTPRKDVATRPERIIE